MFRLTTFSQLFLAVLLLLALLPSAHTQQQTTYDTIIYDTIIIGCDPSGIQSSIAAQNLKLSYITIESSSNCGSFFETYPRKKSLISFNKVSVPDPFESWDAETYEDYKLRFDWHTMLNSSSKFTTYTDQFYPDSETYLRYLHDVVEQ